MALGSVIYDTSTQSTADSSWSYDAYLKFRESLIDLSYLFTKCEMTDNKHDVQSEIESNDSSH